MSDETRCQPFGHHQMATKTTIRARIRARARNPDCGTTQNCCGLGPERSASHTSAPRAWSQRREIRRATLAEILYTPARRRQGPKPMGARLGKEFPPTRFEQTRRRTGTARANSGTSGGQPRSAHERALSGTPPAERRARQKPSGNLASRNRAHALAPLGSGGRGGHYMYSAGAPPRVPS